jgi:hypothetical protein
MVAHVPVRDMPQGSPRETEHSHHWHVRSRRRRRPLFEQMCGYTAADDATVAAPTSPATWIARRGARVSTTGPMGSVPPVVVATTLACRGDLGVEQFVERTGVVWGGWGALAVPTLQLERLVRARVNAGRGSRNVLVSSSGSAAVGDDSPLLPPGTGGSR